MMRTASVETQEKNIRNIVKENIDNVSFVRTAMAALMISPTYPASIPPSLLYAGSHQRQRCIEQCIVHSVLAIDRGRSSIWKPQWRGKKVGSYHK